MDAMEVKAIVEASGGLLLNGNSALRVSRIVRDSREDCSRALYVPLAGERFDGHDFIEQAAAAGAVGAFISKDIKANLPKDFILIRVADTLKAYQAVARASRLRYNVSVIAITGSCGKTSTKNLLSNVLGNRKVARTEKNENNEVGVPLTLLRMDGETQAAIIECGMRAKGEIADLASIARPTHGLITNIESTHIGRLGSLEAIADAKGELLEALGRDNFAFLNADNAWTPRLMKKTEAKITTFGIEAGDVRATDIHFSLDGARFTLETPAGTIEAGVPFPGRGTVYNAAAAAAVALSLG
ncbi:MAG: Mur ligase family protein, partial [bacterium]